jgi:hypothetical protein
MVAYKNKKIALFLKVQFNILIINDKINVYMLTLWIVFVFEQTAKKGKTKHMQQKKARYYASLLPLQEDNVPSGFTAELNFFKNSKNSDYPVLYQDKTMISCRKFVGKNLSIAQPAI